MSIVGGDDELKKSKELMIPGCKSITCLEGRYLKHTELLEGKFDEKTYYQYRILIELLYFSNLTGIKLKYDVMKDFKEDDYIKILKHEEILQHDVKAIEYFIKNIPEIQETHKSHLIHLGLTSQDVCSPAINLCIINGTQILLYQMQHLINTIKKQFILPENTNIYMLGFTHGQPATPTHFRKEILIYYTRLKENYDNITQHIKSKLTIKFGGATGEFNAMTFLKPDTNWGEWCDNFISKLCLTPNIITPIIPELSEFTFIRTKYTNQCDNYDSIIQLLYLLKIMLHILEQFRLNIWLYIQKEYLIQQSITTEVGSSTMPHKTNPVSIENAKTSIKLAKQLIDGIADILTETTYQRDISDSSAMRNINSVYAYILISINNIIKGISRLTINEPFIKEDLDNHPEIILEGIQTYLKFYCNITDSYEQLKTFSRGNKLTLIMIHNFIDSLDILQTHKNKLKELKPSNYIGQFNLFN